MNPIFFFAYKKNQHIGLEHGLFQIWFWSNKHWMKKNKRSPYNKKIINLKGNKQSPKMVSIRFRVAQNRIWDKGISIL